jgi:uncharacterized protein YjlB
MSDAKKKSEAKLFFLDDDGRFPNSPLPVIYYPAVLRYSSLLPYYRFKRLFAENNWKNSWKDGIYDFQHYHSTTHEVIGVCKGKTTVLLGGDNGIKLHLSQGDALIIPAGVVHKNLTPGNSFTCIGAYPDGRDYDMNYGNFVERPKADENIRSVPIPQKDPVFGSGGELKNNWSKK